MINRKFRQKIRKRYKYFLKYEQLFSLTNKHRIGEKKFFLELK